MSEPRMPEIAVYVVHLEDPPGSGLAACSGYLLPRLPAGGSKWLCTGCANAGKPQAAVAAALEAAVERVENEWSRRHIEGGRDLRMVIAAIREGIKP